jgi:hypothetical protein
MPGPLGRFIFWKNLRPPLEMTWFCKCRVFAVFAIGLACALVPAASARQPDTDTQKAATTKKTIHKRHATSAHSGATTATSQTGKHSSRRKKSTRVRGQQKIDSDRARSIQEALIREHYLNGEPTGTWNAASEDAMRRYQADHGWQSKTVPDSRALISLGLGPNKDHLLNPESAMTTIPATPRSDAPAATSQSPAPVSTPVPPTQTDSPSPQ